MAYAKTWTVIFRCYHCGRRFTLRHVTFERVDALHAVAPCPHCGARPVVKSWPDESAASRSHRLVELSDDMETIFRKAAGADTWHFDPECTHWPAENFIELEAVPRIGRLCNECGAKDSFRENP